MVNKDVDQASLRIGTSVASAPKYDYITGDILSFNAVSAIKTDEIQEQEQISDQQLDNLLNEVVVPNEEEESKEEGLEISNNTDIPKDQIQHQQILSFLESSQKYLISERSSDEEQKNDLGNLNIDDILKKKQQQAQIVKKTKEESKSKVVNNELPKEKEEEKKQVESQQEDEIDIIVQDSSAFRQALEQNKQNQQIPQIAMKIDGPLIMEKWHEVDNLDMRRFKEMIPNPAIEYPFELDDFQKRAVYRLEQGNCVFVAAHTSAGKTVVAEYAIALALKHMTKTIYTSPIKALSNQKYREFKDKFTDVGILTGDVTLNKSASCVVMTTEILQEMLYNDSDYLKDVEWERGSVWEEVIMKLPDYIQIVMLSATVPNYREFADWVGRTKRKKIYVQMTEKRPVPLQHVLLFKDKLTVLKDEFNKVYSDNIKSVLKQERNDNDKKWRDEQKNAAKKGEESKDTDKKKEIDFKEKAMKAKEKTIQKIAAKAQKSANNGGGGGQGPNSQNKQKKKYEKFQKYLTAITREKLLPCVVFCFSRAACEEIPSQLDENLEFTTGMEKGEIKNFLKQKLQRLNESDRTLPQIINIQKLLIRGIGFHHAGMLPIVKEIVEILFCDGYLKVIFATTTFAIGLNMPARSVMFTQVNKWNGEQMQLLETSEYLQMAGRAGRRGKDATGSSILLLDRAFGKLPDLEDFEKLFENKGTPLESKLKLSYQMTLNAMKNDDVHISDIIKSSFLESENEKERQLSLIRAQQLQLQIQKASHLECTCGDFQQMTSYFQIYQEICRINDNIWIIIANQIVSGCILEVLSPRFFFQKLIALKRVSQKETLCLYIKDNYEEPTFYNNEEEQKLGEKQLNRGFKGSTYYEYVIVEGQHVVKVCENFVSSIYSKQADQMLFKDQLVKILKQHFQNNKYFNDAFAEFKKIQQFTDWKKPPPTTLMYIKERQVLLDKLAQLKQHKCKFINKHIGQFSALHSYEEEMKQCRSTMNTGGVQKIDDFKAKIQVLIHYKHLDYDLNLLFKGKVAQCFPSTNKILLTELMFSGILKELSNEEILALFSVVIQSPGRADESEARISETFHKALNFLNDECLKIIETEQRFNVQDNEGDVTQRLNYAFYEIVYEWANQKPFVEVVKLNKVDEGLIVRVIMSVERLCRHIKDAARVIGDAILAQRMDQAQQLIKRDIIFTPSLYLE